VTKKKIFEFQNLVIELIRTERYAELITLIEAHLDEIIKVREQHSIISRIKFRLERYGTASTQKISSAGEILERFFEAAQKKFSFRKWLRIKTAKLSLALSNLLPGNEKYSVVVNEIFNTLLFSKEFLVLVSKTKPYLVLRFLPDKVPKANRFFDEFLKIILNQPGSILFFEIENQYYHPDLQSPGIAKTYPLLHFLFSNAKRAEQLGVWKPIGDEMILLLNQLHESPESDPYNYPVWDFAQDGKWGSPIFAGLIFFDLMVTSALHQGIEWHMWLYYFTHFCDRIVRNFHEPSYDPVSISEWPNRYGYILYTMFTIMRDWVLEIKKLPLDQKNIALERVDGYHENINIPKSSIIALSNCTRTLLGAENVSHNFKEYIADIVFDFYFKLRGDDELKDYSVVLQKGLKGETWDDPEITLEIMKCFDNFDHIPYNMDLVKEFRQLMTD
jgi:hypothetical protein